MPYITEKKHVSQGFLLTLQEIKCNDRVVNSKKYMAPLGRIAKTTNQDVLPLASVTQ